MPENNERLPFLRLGWTIWFVILVLSAFIVPYAFLTNLPKISGAFLFWTLFVLAAIISIFRVTDYWRD
ncbi:MAG: hypothetical protein AB1523_12170 [Bacillota bacterium]